MSEIINGLQGRVEVPTIHASLSNPTYTGAPGYTPVKGVDYYTEAEKADLLDELGEQASQIIEDAIPDISGLATKAEVAEVENAIPDISGLATKTELNAIGDAIPDISGLQTQLTAGENITIANDGTISATGGVPTYILTLGEQSTELQNIFTQLLDEEIVYGKDVSFIYSNSPITTIRLQPSLYGQAHYIFLFFSKMGQSRSDSIGSSYEKFMYGSMCYNFSTHMLANSNAVKISGEDVYDNSNPVQKITTVLTNLKRDKANSADLATVATTGDYEDLDNLPTIPTVPTTISSFTNDAGYQTASNVATAISGKQDTLTPGDGIVIDADNEITYDPDVLSTVDYVDGSITATIDWVEDTYQPKLTAGTNITIDSNNVISASGGGKEVVYITKATINNYADILNELLADQTKFTDYDIYASEYGSSWYHIIYLDKYSWGNELGAYGILGGSVSIYKQKFEWSYDGTTWTWYNDSGFYEQMLQITAGGGLRWSGQNGNGGVYSFCNGTGVATGTSSHAEGHWTSASGDYSHAEGHSTGAGSNATGAHVEGYGTNTTVPYQHVQGQNNVWRNMDNFADIVGNGGVGTHASNSNASALDWDGNLRLMGNVYVGCNADSTGGTMLGGGSSYTAGTGIDITNGVISLSLSQAEGGSF